MIEDEPPPAPGGQQGGIQLDAIFNTTTYAARPPVELQFRPWHKPRKQVIREEQWGNEVAWLIAHKPASDSTLRYLGLAGPDLLDIRYLHQRFCQGGTRELTFLGFDEAALPTSPYRDALNISLREVRSLARVSDQSDILGDDFRLLADRNSIAWDRANNMGPFDVVNIDLCGHLAKDEPAIDMSIYNAIHGLCGLQQRRSTPWSLFLTSRMIRDRFSANALIRLIGALQDNLTNCAPFATAFHALLNITEATMEASASWNGFTFFNASTIAITKWLLGLAMPMRHRFSISNSVGYRVWSGSPHFDMLSIVLRFEPLNRIPADSYGLASANPDLPSECSQAALLPGKVADTVDIDAELNASSSLRALFIEKAAALLQQARYDPDAYRKWVETDGQIPRKES